MTHAASAAPILEVRDIKISFPSVDAPPVLAAEHLSLSVQKGEFLAILGPSGCGKSSLLNAMAGLCPVSGGEILLEGVPVSGISGKIGYISQADHLLPWRRVIDNVALGLELRGVPKQARQEQARELLQSMGLSDFERHYPHELSGGMKKRVTIARAIATQPQVLFMDEPFGPLDAFTKERLQEDILEIWEQRHQTIVYVTHDLTEAISLADRVLLMGGRPGQIRGEYAVSLPRPRRVMESKFLPEFVALEQRIWQALRQELSEKEAGGYDF